MAEYLFVSVPCVNPVGAIGNGLARVTAPGDNTWQCWPCTALIVQKKILLYVVSTVNATGDFMTAIKLQAVAASLKCGQFFSSQT